MIFKINHPLELFGLEEQNGVYMYGKEPLSFNGLVDEKINELFKKPKLSCYSFNTIF